MEDIHSESRITQYLGVSKLLGAELTLRIITALLTVLAARMAAWLSVWNRFRPSPSIVKELLKLVEVQG